MEFEVIAECPNCGVVAPVSDAREAGITFTDAVCEVCRAEAITALTMDDFDRAYARATANGWAD